MKGYSAVWLWITLAACEPVEVKTSTDFGVDDSTAEPQNNGSGGSAESSTEPESDACDDTPGTIICSDGVSIECDDSGDIGDVQTCSPDEVCVDLQGCLDCTLEIQFATDTTPSLRTRPQMTESNFIWERLHATPLAVSANDPFPADSEIVLTRSEGSASWWTPEGEELPSSFAVTRDALPVQILIHAHGTEATNIDIANDACSSEVQSFELITNRQPPMTGHPIDGAPWLARTQVFNQDEEIWATLTSFRHPHLVDTEFDVYVTEHRSPTGWAENQTLSDVRSSGANTVRLSPDSPSENQWSLGTGFAEIGEARTKDFDVVLDVNQNGQLDPGDLSYGPGDQHGGLTLMGNLAAPGPSSVGTFTYESEYWLGQKVYYPEDIAGRPPAPLVVISHGNGHDFLWYDYLGGHLASHGYVVMSHRNNTGPGIETASTTTIENTDHLLERKESVGGGVLAGRIDDSRIVWIGHSRGGEGVARAFDRIVDEEYRTENFNEDDIVLISSIAPTVFNTVAYSDPHDKPYHLFAGAADGDVTGGPNYEQVQYFRLSSAAEGPTQVTYLHGVSHNDFNCCGADDGTGPDLIGPDQTQQIAKAYYLALIRAYASGHTPSLDYFKRSADAFRPYGIASEVTIASEYRPHPESGSVVIDDFQANWDEETATSGAELMVSVDAFDEGKLDDANANLSWGGGDPMNGMTQACCDGDQNRGAVFQWNDPADIIWSLPDDMQDLSALTFLSVRAAQGTRNDNTVDLDAALDFSVTLSDTEGVESTVWTGDLGQITSPYKRSGLGRGSGWSNEFNTIRIRIASFQDGQPSLNLKQINSIRFDFGGEYGSAYGRLGIDDLLLEY